MDTFTDNLELAEYVANRVAGRRGTITLRSRHPIYQRAKGMTMRVKEKGFFIDIDPDTPPMDQLKTYFHEVAHIYMGHLDGIDGVEELDQLPPRHFTGSRRHSEDDQRQEQAADVLGGVWYTYAEKSCRHYGADTIENRLTAFLEWVYL